MKAIAGTLWLYTSKLHLSSDDCSLLFGVDHRAIRALFESFYKFFVPLKEQLNDAIVVEGCSADVKLDEISFWSTGRAHGIVWLRYLAVARRGSSLVWLQRLDYRITRKEQGGGPISVDEMWSALLLDSDQPVLVEGSVCHTDGAKAYCWLSSPLNDGSLVNAAGLKLSHTSVLKGLLPTTRRKLAKNPSIFWVPPTLHCSSKWSPTHT